MLDGSAAKKRKKDESDDERAALMELSEPGTPSDGGEEEDYWGGLGTPSDLSSDGRDEYEAWKKAKEE